MQRFTQYAVSISEAAQRLGISRSYLYVAIRNHQIRVTKFGRRSLIQIDELERFIQDNTIDTKGGKHE